MAILYKMKYKGEAITIVSGRIAGDPKWVEVGTGICKFSIPTTKSWKDKAGEWHDDTTWHNIEVSGEFGSKLMERIKKGDIVRVVGEIGDREVGDKVYRTLRPNFGGVRVLFSAEGEEQQAPAARVADDDNELPF